MIEKRRASEYSFYKTSNGREMTAPIAILHRGGDAAGAEKENTLAAFRSARDAGFIYIETDVIVSRDGIPFTFHGKTNERKELQRLTAAEIGERRIDGEPIPQLADVLREFPDMRFFIDPQKGTPAELVADVIREAKAEDRVSIGAFNYRRTRKVAELLGGQDRIATSLGVMGSFAMIGLGFRPTRRRARAFFDRTKATSLQVPYILRGRMRRMVKEAHESGLHVIVWPLNPKRGDNVAYMEGAIARGVSGLMSDHTDDLKQTVQRFSPQNTSIRK